MAMVEQLLHILEELNDEEFKKFMFCLSRVDTDPHIPSGKLDGASRIRVAELLEKRYPREALDLTNQVLHKIPRRDLIQGSWLQAGEAGNSSDDASCSEAVNSGAGAREPRAQEKQRLVSEQQLMTLARKMGKTWQQIGIELLGLKKHCLEQIEENNPGNATMRAFEMLLEWRKQARQGASASALHSLLCQDTVLQPEALECLLDAGST